MSFEPSYGAPRRTARNEYAWLTAFFTSPFPETPRWAYQPVEPLKKPPKFMPFYADAAAVAAPTATGFDPSAIATSVTGLVSSIATTIAAGDAAKAKAKADAAKSKSDAKAASDLAKIQARQSASTERLAMQQAAAAATSRDNLLIAGGAALATIGIVTLILKAK